MSKGSKFHKRRACVVGTMLIVSVAIVAGTISAVSSDQPSRQPGTCGSAVVSVEIEACTQIIRTGGLNANELASAYHNRALAYLVGGQYDKAISDCNEAIRLKPDDDRAFDYRGRAYESRGQHDQAIVDFTHAVGSNPDDADAFFDRGNAYDSRGKSDQAIADFSKSIALLTDDSLKTDDNLALINAYDARGLAYEKKNQFDQAIADYSQAIRLTKAPFNSIDYLNRGRAYLMEGQYRQAIADLNEFINLSPSGTQNPYVFYFRGIAKLRSGDTIGGNADISAAKAIDPKHF